MGTDDRVEEGKVENAVIHMKFYGSHPSFTQSRLMKNLRKKSTIIIGVFL